MAIISPSLLAADFNRLGEEVEMLNQSQADWIHLDVMDGVFVPNISFGFPIIESVAKISQLPLDVHLMIVDPGRYINRLRDAGAGIVNVHLEACRHINRDIQSIRDAGMKAAVTLNPATPVMMLEDIIADVDMVLLMSVNPGFAGQKFIPGTIDKVKRLRAMLDAVGSKAIIQVDGGINAETGKLAIDAGADALVAGNYIFHADNPSEKILLLKSL